MSKHIWITGGTSGLGKGLAERYLKAGHQVSLFSRTEHDANASLIEKTNCNPEQLHWFHLDVCDCATVIDAFKQAANIQAPDVIIHSAGIAKAIAFKDESTQSFSHMLDVNLNGTQYVAKTGLPYLSKGGQLILVSSMAGIVACYGYSAYAATKAAVIQLADILRLEYKSQGIHIGVVCPPEVDTPLVEEEKKSRPPHTATMKYLAGELTTDEACDSIFKGINKKKFLIIPGKQAKALYLLLQFVPLFLVQKVSDLLLAYSVRRNK